MCAAVGTASHQHGLEACTVCVVDLEQCWKITKLYQTFALVTECFRFLICLTHMHCLYTQHNTVLTIAEELHSNLALWPVVPTPQTISHQLHFQKTEQRQSHRKYGRSVIRRKYEIKHLAAKISTKPRMSFFTTTSSSGPNVLHMKWIRR